MIIYISGKMGDLTKEEYQPIFNNAQKKLEADGHKVFNPADDGWVEWLNYSYQKTYGLQLTNDYDNILLADLQFLLGLKHIHGDNFAVFMLNNWEQSDGAVTEHSYAKAIGIKILYEESYVSPCLRNFRIEIVNFDKLLSDIECYKKMFPNSYTTIDGVKYFLAKDYFENHGNTGLFGLSVSKEWEDRCFSFEFRGYIALAPTYEYMGIFKC